MDLNNLTYILRVGNIETPIEEPSGFDGFTLTMKRGDYHGMSAEFGESTLSFYGAAIGVIDQAYESDIDTLVEFCVKNGDDVLYTGALDLSTYERKSGEYNMVTCMVGEIGVKTTFNNRTETDIDLTANKTIDGAEIANTPTWVSMHIPNKHLLYTNELEQEGVVRFYSLSNWRGASESTQFVFKTAKTNEFGSVNTDGILFNEDEDFNIKYGINTTMRVNSTFIVRYRITSLSIVTTSTANAKIKICSGETTLKEQGIELATSIGVDHDVVVNYNGEISTDNPFFIKLELSGTGTFYMSINFSLVDTITVGHDPLDPDPFGKTTYISHCTMKMYDNLPDTNVHADMTLVHDALNAICEAASENALQCKSEWYENTPVPGGGALKMLTNGYKIRGLYTNGELDRNMPLSFKAAIQSLDALDCIGWGFSTENGTTCVRVERWDWFYKDNVLMEIIGANSIKRKVDTQKVYSSLNIGYKKYATNDEYNSIDSVHGERTFTNSIKAISNEKSVSCDFIADNYAIEETRRAREDVDDSKEFKYDENIFVFEVTRTPVGNEFDIKDTGYDATGIERVFELINAKLSPRHCAARWKDYLFSTNNSTPYAFTSGEINYKAAYKVRDYYASDELQPGVYKYGLKPYGGITARQAENESIAYNHAIFKAETLELEYPINLNQYKAILANPYGLVIVNGEPCWIKEMKYSLATGLASFVLTPKYVNN